MLTPNKFAAGWFLLCQSCAFEAVEHLRARGVEVHLQKIVKVNKMQTELLA